MRILGVLRALIDCDAPERGGLGVMGRAFQPHFKKVLPVLDILKDTGGDIEEAVYQILQAMEVNGDPATVTALLKGFVPTYASVLVLASSQRQGQAGMR